MKRMLFNATQAEELRVAIVDGQKLIDLDIESAAKEQRKSNIYKGVITRIEPSLEAAFVDYGAERHGFLPFKEVSRAYFQTGIEASRATIKEALREGQEIIVQVDKDERGNKGAALTTFVSLAGRYLVLMPNNPRGGGVSRRVEGDERAELREAMDQLHVPQGMSLIARTAAIGRNAEELQWDLNYLMQLWKAIDGAANQQKGAFLIYQEGSLVIRAIRDYFQPDIGEILIDTDEVFEQAQQFMAHVMPGNVNRVKRYRDDVPLFSRFQIEHQIESAYSRQVTLPSGGAIVIDHTEALVSVDVNSGRATRGSDIEETAFKTNAEAAEEVARQLRLRDLGGLIVIDFIDMENQRNQREVENRLRDALRFDRARVQTGKISRFGLMELSRQRLRPALAETSYIPCPRCSGTGHIRSAESAALHILRILEEEAMKDNTAAVHTQVPVDVATFLLNEKRADIQAIELRHKVSVLLIPNIHLETPQHSIVRLRHDELNQEELQQPSYKMVDVPADDADKSPSAAGEARPPRQEAAIKNITPAQPAPIVPEKAKTEAPQPAQNEASGGIISKIFSWFRGNRSAEAAPAPEAKPTGSTSTETPREGRRGGRHHRRDEERDNREGREGREKRGNRENKDAREAREPKPPRDEAQKPREPKEAREPREPREPRRQRNEPRPERKEQTASAVPAPDNKAPLALNAHPAIEPQNSTAELTAEESGNNARRRGRRGGRRDRNERPANENLPAESSPAAVAPAPETAEAAEAAETRTPPLAEASAKTENAPFAQPAPQESAATPQAVEIIAATLPENEAVDETVENRNIAPEPAATPVAIAPEQPMPSAPQAEKTVVLIDDTAPLIEAPTAAPLEVQESAAPAVEATAPDAPFTKPIDVKQALEESGLVMIETSSEKRQSLQATAAPETPPAPVRRTRPAPVAVTEEPLMMVETRK